MNFIQNIVTNYREVLLNTARIFSSVFEILLSYILVNSFFKPAIKKKNLDFIPFIVLAAAVIVLQETGIITPLAKYIIVCAVLTLILFIFYEGRKRMKAIGAGLFIIMVVVSVSSGKLVYGLISRNFNIQEGSFGTLITLSLADMFMVFFALVISFVARKSKPDYSVNVQFWIALLTCPVITIITFAVFQFYLETSNPDDRIVVYIYVSGAGLILLNILVFWLFRKLQNTLEMKRENDILTSQLKLQSESIVNLENSYNRTRTFRHDIKNHILTMNVLAEQGKFDELKSYLKEMSGIIDESSYVRISGISAVDAILNEKMYEAQSDNITTSFDVINLEKNSIDPLDLCIILSNALDNAIEANRKIDDVDRRSIKLKIHGNSAFSIISISNPADDAPEKTAGGRLMTSKNDTENHGLGLRSIESSVNKYKGEMMHKCENGTFTIVIRLPAPSKNQYTENK